MNLHANAPRTKEERIRLLAEYERSGLSKKEFCADRKINYQTFIGWGVQQRDRNKPGKKEFVPLKIAEGPVGIFAEILLERGRKVIFHQPVASEILLAVLKC